MYLFLATLLSVWSAAQMPAEGPPIQAFLPAGSLVVLRLKDGDSAWRAVRTHPAFQALWADEEFQRHTKALAQLTQARLDLSQRPAPVRAFFSLDRPGLRFALGGELAFVLLAPAQGQAAQDPPPALVFLRLQGARGGVARILAPSACRRRAGLVWHDLGGGLVALGLNGAQPAAAAALLPAAAPCAEGVVAELRVRPGATAAAQSTSLWSALEGTPSLSELLALARPPDEICLRFHALQDGVVQAGGEWSGALPPASAAAPLLQPELAEGATPLLDYVGPLSLRAAFWRELKRQMDSSAKSRARWESRLGNLAEAGVDLERDLWPDFGRTLHFQITPPAEGSGTGQALALFSLPFQGRQPARQALAELARVYGNGLFDDAAERGARKPYFVRVTRGALVSYVWVRGSYTRPLGVVGGGALAFMSDAGPLALAPGGPGLAPPGPRPANAPLVSLQADGVRLAQYVGALVQMELEDQRDEVGAADFLRAFPDERAFRQLCEKLCRLVGDLRCEVRGPEPASAAGPARVTLRWRPHLTP